jgi:hypothetical protein
MANYNTTVQYYRINANNTALATSNSGGAANAPTEEITAPVNGCTYDSGASGATIEGTASGGQDFNDFSVNQYLYYIDSTTGAYVLMGQIESITDADTLVLYDNSLAVPTSGDQLVASYFLITNTESLYMRIATEVGGSAGTNKMNIPDFSKWRTSSDVVAGLNNTNITKLEQISNVGTPVSEASPTVNIPFTIQTMNVFTTGTGTNANNAWPSTASFPSYIWIKITPATTNNSLSSKTMYRLTTEETVEAYNASINTAISVLQTKGYNISATSSGGTTTDL